MVFINSKELHNRIQELAVQIAMRTDNKVQYEEYIVLPFYGNIILRFDLKDPDASVEDLDIYESIMYDVVKDEFLVDFMGNVYRRMGLDYQCLDTFLRRASIEYVNEPLYKSKYASAINTDTERLLRLCKLDVSNRVWEIQPEDEIVLLIMKANPGESRTIEADGCRIVVAEVDEECCQGLMQATFHAKRTKRSLLSVLTSL